MMRTHLQPNTGRCPRSLLFTAALLILYFGDLQQAAAQEFAGIRSMQILKQVPVNASVAEQEMDSLAQKLSVLQNPNSQALLQLKMLSPRSRGKLDRSLDDKALAWLKNQTDAKLADILESIRATNFRRSMAMSYIYNSLPGAMKGNGVIFALQRLQVEDLERFASLPLWEPRYQNLTNVTLTDLANQIYNFGETQVKRRTCVLTQANTSTVTPLPISSVTSTLAKHHRRALRSNPIVDTSAFSGYAAQQQQQQLELVEEGWQHDAVLSAAQDDLGFYVEVELDDHSKQLDSNAESGSTFFRPFRRHFLQADTPTGGQVSEDTTVAYLVAEFLKNLTGTTASPAGVTSAGDTSSLPAATPGEDGTTTLVGGDYSTTDEEGFANGLSGTQFELPEASSSGTEPSEVPLTQDFTADNTTAAIDPLLCSVNPNGTYTFANGTECTPPRPKPCAQDDNGTRINETACAIARNPCRRRLNGTLLNATRCELAIQRASDLECINGTRNGTFPPLPCESVSPCVNGTLDGTLLPCNKTDAGNSTTASTTNGTSNGTSPCVGGLIEGTTTPCNASADAAKNSTGNSTNNGTLLCVQGYLAGTTVPCNGTASVDAAVANGTAACVDGVLQGTATPCNATDAATAGITNTTGNITEAAVVGNESIASGLQAGLQGNGTIEGVNGTSAVGNDTASAVPATSQASLCLENGTFVPCPSSTSSADDALNQTALPNPQGPVTPGTPTVAPEVTPGSSPVPDNQAGNGTLNTAGPSAESSPTAADMASGPASPSVGSATQTPDATAVVAVPSPEPGSSTVTAPIPGSSSSTEAPAPDSSLTVPGSPQIPQADAAVPVAPVAVTPTDTVTPTAAPTVTPDSSSSSSSSGPSSEPAAESPATPQTPITTPDQPSPASSAGSSTLASPAPADDINAAAANPLVQPTTGSSGITEPVTESNNITPVTPVTPAVQGPEPAATPAVTEPAPPPAAAATETVAASQPAPVSVPESTTPGPALEPPAAPATTATAPVAEQPAVPEPAPEPPVAPTPAPEPAAATATTPTAESTPAPVPAPEPTPTAAPEPAATTTPPVTPPAAEPAAAPQPEPAAAPPNPEPAAAQGPAPVPEPAPVPGNANFTAP